MGRGGAMYLSYTALVFLSRATGSSAGLWTVDIDLSPAPPAESGPAFSAHASRNRDLLPYQIVGVVGAYVGSVLIIGTLLLTVGRRLRKQAVEMAQRPREMIKPAHKNFDPSPTSPTASARGWLKKKTGSMRSGRSDVGSPGMRSVASFDQRVVDEDRRRQENEMAQLYGHVLNFDEARAQGEPPAYPRKDRPTLPALQRVQTSDPVQSAPLSPRSPGSPYYAISPPKNLLAQLSPTYKPPQSELKQSREARATSSGSHQTHESSPAKLKKSIKNRLGKLDISSPVQGMRDNDDGARTPLSPRFYTDPGAPPEPPSARTVDTYPYSPTTPGTARSYPFPEEDEDFDDVRDLPDAHPQRPRRLTNNSQPPQSPASPGLPSSPAQFRVGSPARRGVTPVGDTSRPLALRQFNEQYKQENTQQSQLNVSSPTANMFPMSPSAPWNTRPAPFGALKSPAIQTTVLSAPGNLRMGPQTAQDQPYSPFFPGVYTTPVTPHFTTRAERKQKEKEEKAIRGAITEEDQVPDESDLWRDGY